ncbi:MAG: NUDIX hydrolase [Anaerolineae bacterium]|jgi:ADP-ribose pyrophosphatase|nr:NUDIX hydrolase [Anaerolineae bacterium]
MKKFHIIHEQEVFKKAIFKVDEAQIQHTLPDGTMSPEITRLNFVRGDSVAVLVHDTVNNTFIFTYQFRYPTTKHNLGWIHEIPAGSLPDGKDPQAHMREEMMEEIGYAVQELQYIKTFYVSPGGTSERIILYYARVTPKDQKSAGGGLAHEGEFVERVIMKVDDALKLLDNADVGDAKTIIALQWFKMNRKKQGLFAKLFGI